MANVFDITAIEEVLATYFATALSYEDDTVRVLNDRPKTLPETYGDFAVVKVSGNVPDLRTHSEFTVTLSLFAKDVGVIKNGRRLSVLQQRALAACPVDLGALCLCDYPKVAADGSDNFGFHWRMITFDAVAKIRL